MWLKTTKLTNKRSKLTTQRYISVTSIGYRMQSCLLCATEYLNILF